MENEIIKIDDEIILQKYSIFLFGIYEFKFREKKAKLSLVRNNDEKIEHIQKEIFDLLDGKSIKGFDNKEIENKINSIVNKEYLLLIVFKLMDISIEELLLPTDVSLLELLNKTSIKNDRVILDIADYVIKEMYKKDRSFLFGSIHNSENEIEPYFYYNLDDDSIIGTISNETPKLLVLIEFLALLQLYQYLLTEKEANSTPPEQTPQTKPKGKVSFKWLKNDKSLDLLYKLLINADEPYIDKNLTSIEAFREVFNEIPIDNTTPKIKWLRDTKIGLQYLLKVLQSKSMFGAKPSYWNIAKYIFVDKDGLSINISRDVRIASSSSLEFDEIIEKVEQCSLKK